MVTIYEFDDCVVDSERFELRRGGTVEHVEPQVFDVLLYLIRHRDRVVTKAELLDNVWGDRFVSESALASRLKSARRGVGDDGASQRVIRTVFGRGYQFVAPVAEQAPRHRRTGTGSRRPAPVTDGRPAAPDDPLLHGVRRRPHRLRHDGLGPGAGQGRQLADPPRLRLRELRSGGTGWRASPRAARWSATTSGAAGCRTGTSTTSASTTGSTTSSWSSTPSGSTASRCSGVSQGAAVAVAFAARHPERVARLVLAGAYGRGRLVRATTEEQRREAALDLEVARVGWGRDDPSFRQMFTSQFLPDGTREQWEEFNELQRRTTSAHNAVRFLETFSRIDVTAIARRCTCPTLMLHSRDDRRVPLSTARELATLDPRLPARVAAEPQPHPDQLGARLADVPRADRPLPRRLSGEGAQDAQVAVGSGWAPRIRRPGVAPVDSPSARISVPATNVCR